MFPILRPHLSWPQETVSSYKQILSSQLLTVASNHSHLYLSLFSPSSSPSIAKHHDGVTLQKKFHGQQPRQGDPSPSCTPPFSHSGLREIRRLISEHHPPSRSVLATPRSLGRCALSGPAPATRVANQPTSRSTGVNQTVWSCSSWPRAPPKHSSAPRAKGPCVAIVGPDCSRRSGTGPNMGAAPGCLSAH